MRLVAVGAWVAGLVLGMSVGARRGEAQPAPDDGTRAFLPQVDDDDTPQIAGRARYVLRPDPDGDGYVYQHDTFTAHIATDGSVTFDDHTLRLGPSGLVGAVGAGQWTARPEDDSWLGYGYDWPAPYGIAPSASPYEGYVPVAPWRRGVPPDVGWFEYPPVAVPLAAIGAQFDITDVWMRAHDQDPYAYEKAQFLEATFETRLQLARDDQTDRMRGALRTLRNDLDRLWNDVRLSTAQRRRVLFDLWSEMSDDDNGRAARGIVERFIRERLPEGSPQGYSAAELERYRAAAGFDPYQMPDQAGQL